MCGIGGLTQSLHSKENLEAAFSCLKERGPDYRESKQFDSFSFLHTRLKIIDLSAVANQPMCNEDGNVWLVFNGEIYNYRTLRERLVANGHVFKSQTDSEVIIHLYEELGDQLWKELRGMFAIAILDTKKNRLLVGRDRFGIKPLFYYYKNGDFAFASNINSLKALNGVDLIINQQAIYDFCSFFYIPAPSTFYSNIHALLPGEYLDIKLQDAKVQNFRKHKYHDWKVEKLAELSEEESTEQLHTLLRKAVKSEIESDVPLGSLLSGGIDSSLVSALAQQELNPEKLNTFNVKFPDAINDETWAALAVAEHIGSKHLTLNMESGSGSWEELSEVLRYCGQPFADTSIFAVNKVSELVSKHVTVCLSGDGGDEGFSGYSTHLQAEKVNKLLSYPGFMRKILFALSDLHKIAPGPLSGMLRRISYFKNEDMVGVIQNFHTWLRPAEHRQLMLNYKNYLPVRRYFEPIVKKAMAASHDSLEQISLAVSLARTDLHLPNDYLFKVDTGTMRSSIENRVPFLDEDLFSFGLQLPHKLKLRNRTNKYLLRKIAARELPEKIIKKPKGGFGLPVDLWVNEDCRKQICQHISDDKLLPQFLQRDHYMQWVNAFAEHKQLPGISREGLYQRVIMLTALHLHLK